MKSPNRLRILERAVESARNGIVITDPNLQDNPIVYANKAFTELTGYELLEILGKNCRFLQGDDRDQEGLRIIRKAIAERSDCLALLRNYRKDGQLFWNELHVSPVYDDDGKLIFFVGIQNDVSARKEAERRVSEFYSMISHELRTPLSSIRASLGLVADGEAGEVSPQVHKLVEIAGRNADRLLKLVDEILDLKKLESGKIKLDLDMVEPAAIVDEAIASLSDLAEARGVTLVKSIQPSKAICADGARVLQVMTNLIGNAIKFSPAGGTIEVGVNPNGNSVKFAVSDQGPGLSDTDLPKLFVKFQQIDSSDTRQHGGSGLGLAICKMLVEMHGGEIGVDSHAGQGSTFWFSLPFVPPAGGSP